MAEIPKWALDMRTKNTVIKRIRGGYYLYEVHCRYLRGEKRKKNEYTYLGRLVEGVGLVPKGGKEEVMRNLAGSSAQEGLREEVERLRARVAELEAMLGAVSE